MTARLTEITITPCDARALLAAAPDCPDPHMLYHHETVFVTAGRHWRRYYRYAGAVLIMTRDDLATIYPEALGYTDVALAAALTLYAGNLDTDPDDERPAGFGTITCDMPGGFWVPACITDPEWQHEPAAPLRILSPATCGHGSTICAECAGSWSYDWDIRWDDTGGGRWLRDQALARTWAAR